MIAGLSEHKMVYKDFKNGAMPIFCRPSKFGRWRGARSDVGGGAGPLEGDWAWAAAVVVEAAYMFDLSSKSSNEIEPASSRRKLTTRRRDEEKQKRRGRQWEEVARAAVVLPASQRIGVGRRPTTGHDQRVNLGQG